MIKWVSLAVSADNNTIIFQLHDDISNEDSSNEDILNADSLKNDISNEDISNILIY
jgi:hypothetical protein